MKITQDEKLKFALMHVKDGLSYTDINKKYRVRIETVKYAAALYERYGEKAFKRDGVIRKYTREEKLKAIERVKKSNQSIRSIALELMLTDPRILSDWIEKYDKEGEEGIKDTFSRQAYLKHDDRILKKEYNKLLEDLERTKAENEYLKKLVPLFLEKRNVSKKK